MQNPDTSLIMQWYLEGKKIILKRFLKFTRKHLCLRPSLLLENDSSAGVFLWIFWDFLEHIFYVKYERLLLVLVSIGLVWSAANLTIFCIIDSKAVPEILRYSFQLILHWWTTNQYTKFDNTTQVIGEVYLYIQEPARRKTVI